MSNSKSNNGIGFGGLLQIAFITLKLCGVINWSWWWVLSPVLSGVLVVLLFVAIFILVEVKK